MNRDSGPVVHTYTVVCAWEGDTSAGYDSYDRNHQVDVVGAGRTIVVSADPYFGGDIDQLDPEQLLVVAAASCQLLSFLAVAARARLTIRSYRDQACGRMSGHHKGAFMERIDLRPVITVAAGTDVAKVERSVELAHEQCYIANSLRGEVVIDPAIILEPAVNGRDPGPNGAPNRHEEQGLAGNDPAKG